MKKLKNILAALAELRARPSTVIADAWAAIKADHPGAGVGEATLADIELIERLLAAIVSMAKDDEDKAAAPGKDGK